MSKFNVKNASISTKVTMTSTALIFLVLLFVFIYFPAKQSAVQHKEFLDKMDAVTGMIALGSGVGLGTNQPAVVKNVLDLAQLDESITYIVLLGIDGKKISQYPEELNLAYNRLLLKGDVFFEDNMAGFVHNIYYQGENFGTVLLGASLENIKSAAATTRWTLLIICVAILGIGMLVSSAIGRHFRKNINHVIDLAEAVKSGDFDTKLNIDNQDEIGRLTASLKEIAAAIKENQEGLQNEVVSCLERMAKGEISVSVSGDYRGDNAPIKDALNNAMIALNDILGSVNLAVNQVAGGAQQVSDSSQSLSQGAIEQASALEEIAASMQEMASQTKHNAENANQARQFTIEARNKADHGNKQMQQMLEAMSQINESSGRIGKIIRVIDEIAFQTNLLALNAAVEAAHAGVHGKGFAVVAEEVRNLAQRSAKAARETNELIEASVKSVQNGTEIANATDQALQNIVADVTKVTDLIGEIAIASGEQAHGIEQVNEGLNQIDQVTQSNAAFAEEIASAAEELSGQAVHLKQMLKKFKLTDQCNTLITADTPDEMLAQFKKKQKSIATQDWGGIGTIQKSPSSELEQDTDFITLDDEDFGKF